MVAASPLDIPCSYPFLVHLKSIFIAGTSWKVIQVKTKFTLLTFVRSKEDDSLGLVPLNISLFAPPLWGFPKRFLLLERTLASKRGFRHNTEAQVLAPPPYLICFILCIFYLLKFCPFFKVILSYPF